MSSPNSSVKKTLEALLIEIVVGALMVPLFAAVLMVGVNMTAVDSLHFSFLKSVGAVVTLWALGRITRIGWGYSQ